MIFSSIVFIYYFLPLFLLIYFIVPFKYKNYIILIFSLLFYFIGEPKYIIILLMSCIINYILSILIKKYKKWSKFYLILACIYNIGQLLIFKYLDFFIYSTNKLLNTSIPFMYIIMPIGISFFTFQALGYVIDVYKEKQDTAKNIWTFMTYVCLFPQLIAGPIVRFNDIKNELNKRSHSFDNIYEGIKRFIIGLSKKVLLANILGEFSKSLITETLLSSWLKPVSFTLQIYFDFSGYSDMAIGLGLILGFHFLENFNYPFIASSITDFWHRWHISLSSWFKDYVYIPLGGNRVSKLKFIRNIFIVWFLTGFWHGANWNFIIWGLYFGIILLIEKLYLGKYLKKTKILKYIYTIFIVVISFIIFNSNSIEDIFISLKNMFMITNIPITDKLSIYYFKSYFALIIISIISSTPLLKNIIKKIKLKKIIDILEPITYLVLLTLSTAFLIDESFNPFLYFRF